MGSSFDLDEVDYSILRLLKENSRMSYQEMSRNTGIPDATIQHRFKRMKEHGAINKFTIMANNDATGYAVTSIMLIQTDTERHDEAKTALAEFPEVSEVYGVLGEYDLMIKVWAKSLEELNRFINDRIRSVEGIEDLQEIVLVERVKEESPPV
ncbi:Lrp/AsnC family transcriptional regulator [Methanocella sp. CWC-04]|uniref:Lrp/AsnC family transcriptional regulator n=1 Tax=Methanooceanicella nereidis TaxID=2052831 RepID=A0AAP2RDU8_9EURY|nr:Lrp/AsnC family transcriptional regulator [Methanocella sp. CWC-04]MCD1295479.1 Lrp/AsnC family transcriptional regulator [Methanocella sp. CWC-04]